MLTSFPNKPPKSIHSFTLHTYASLTLSALVSHYLQVTLLQNQTVDHPDPDPPDLLCSKASLMPVFEPGSSPSSVVPSLCPRSPQLPCWLLPAASPPAGELLRLQAGGRGALGRRGAQLGGASLIYWQPWTGKTTATDEEGSDARRVEVWLPQTVSFPTVLLKPALKCWGLV